MRKRHNIINIALIFMLIFTFYAEGYVYSMDSGGLRVPMAMSATKKQYDIRFMQAIMIASGLRTTYDPDFERNNLPMRRLRGEEVASMSEMPYFKYALDAVVKKHGIFRRSINVEGTVNTEGHGDYSYIAISSQSLRFPYCFDRFATVEIYQKPEPRIIFSLNIFKSKKIYEFSISIKGRIVGADFTPIDENRAILILEKDVLNQLLKALGEKDLIEQEEVDRAEGDGRIVLPLKVKEPIIDIPYLNIFIGEVNVRKPFELVILSEANMKAKEILASNERIQLVRQEAEAFMEKMSPIIANVKKMIQSLKPEEKLSKGTRDALEALDKEVIKSKALIKIPLVPLLDKDKMHLLFGHHIGNTFIGIAMIARNALTHGRLTRNDKRNMEKYLLKMETVIAGFLLLPDDRIEGVLHKHKYEYLGMFSSKAEILRFQKALRSSPYLTLSEKLKHIAPPRDL